MCKSEIKCKNYDDEVSVEDKIGRLTRLMRQIRDMGEHPKQEERILRERRMIQILTELEDIKDDLSNLVTGKVTPRQIQFLKDTESSDDDAIIDPSVQFFGVEWNCVFAKCFNIGLNVRIFKQRLAADCVDLGGLAVILQDVGEVRRHMEHHRRALESGALTPGHLARQLHQQLVVTAAAPGGSKKYGGARKHKTENLNRKLQQIEDHEQRRRRKSLSIPHTRKSTFMENVSNLLNYIKH